jgi:hypothetical protein
MTRLCFLYLLIFLSTQSLLKGQILNIEQFRLDKDTSDIWLGNITGGFNKKQQQVNVTTINTSSNLVYLSEKHSYMNINNFRFLKVATTDILSEGYTHWRVNLVRRQRISLEEFFQYQFDRGRGMVRRSLIGSSLRVHVLKTEKFIFGFNSGAMYESEFWEGEVLRKEVETAPRQAKTNLMKSTSNITIRGSIIKDFNVFFVGYYQAPFNDFFRPRVITDLQLQYSFTRRLALNTQFVSTFDAAPLITNNRFIYNLVTGVTFRFQ